MSSQGPVLDAAVEGDEIVAVANDFDMSTWLEPLRARVYRSTNGGQSYVTIHGELGLESSTSAVVAVALSGDTIVLSRGEQILRSTTSGHQWEAHDVGATLLALELVTDDRLVGVGIDGRVRISTDGGVSWSSGVTDSTIDLRGVFFRGEMGWAWGYDMEGGTGPDEEDVVTDGVLLETLDGGESWTTVRSFSDVGVGPAWFDEDGLGFIATSTPDSPGSVRATLSLFRTLDFGETFEDLDIPTNVGTVVMSFLGEQDIHTSFLSLIRVEGASMRLAASAYVAEAETGSGGGGGGDSGTVYNIRTVNYLSSDLGDSWDFDDLGTIEISLTDISSGDGHMIGGKLFDLHSGVMVAQDGRTYALASVCSSSVDCFPGYECEESRCVPPPEQDPEDPDDDPSNGGDPVEDPDETDDEEADGGDEHMPGTGDDTGGCDCVSGTGGAGSALLLLLAAAARTRMTGRHRRQGIRAASPSTRRLPASSSTPTR